MAVLTEARIGGLEKRRLAVGLSRQRTDSNASFPVRVQSELWNSSRSTQETVVRDPVTLRQAASTRSSASPPTLANRAIARGSM